MIKNLTYSTENNPGTLALYIDLKDEIKDNKLYTSSSIVKEFRIKLIEPELGPLMDEFKLDREPEAFPFYGFDCKYMHHDQDRKKIGFLLYHPLLKLKGDKTIRFLLADHFENWSFLES